MKIPFLIAAIALFSSCADFIEYPLEKEQVALLGPVDNFSTTDTLITFWWDTHQDAKAYRLQIVSPDFDKVGSDVIDTLVAGDKARLSLKAGAYTWRVRPENNGSAGIYTYRSLEIKAKN
ncbi:hypothetical protein ACR79T_15585 [Sphingobacterium spiritivorum]|uniref:hypothetical protein n=1 Tax=Sphingobacterium spiritivorum TaxID=258 RepID=UPI003DA666BA